MLSKPWACVSAGRYGVDVDVEVEQVLAPPARTRRASGAGTDASPGLGLLAANSSIRDLERRRRARRSAPSSGRLAPGGGIMPARSLRIIFSMTSGCSCAFIASKLASERPPALPRSLWQVPQ